MCALFACLFVIFASAGFAQDSNSADANSQAGGVQNQGADQNFTDQNANAANPAVDQNFAAPDSNVQGLNLESDADVNAGMHDANIDIVADLNLNIGINGMILDVNSVDKNAIIDSNSADLNTLPDVNHSADLNAADLTVPADINADSGDMDRPTVPEGPNLQADQNTEKTVEIIPAVEKTDVEEAAALKGIAKGAVSDFYAVKKLYTLAPPGEKEGLKVQFREKARLALASQLDYFLFELNLARRQFPEIPEISDSVNFLSEKKVLTDDNSISDGNLVLVSQELNAFWSSKRGEVSGAIMQAYISRLSEANSKVSSFANAYSDALVGLKGAGRDVSLLEGGLLRLNSGNALARASINSLSDSNKIDFYTKARPVVERSAKLSVNLYDLMGYLFFGAKELQSGDEIALSTRQKLESIVPDNSAEQDLNSSILELGGGVLQ